MPHDCAGMPSLLRPERHSAPAIVQQGTTDNVVAIVGWPSSDTKRYGAAGG